MHKHDTNNYFYLIHEVERLIKRGYHKNFVKKRGELGVQRGNAEVVIRKQVRVPMNDGSSSTITMIVGGT